MHVSGRCNGKAGSCPGLLLLFAAPAQIPVFGDARHPFLGGESHAVDAEQEEDEVRDPQTYGGIEVTAFSEAYAEHEQAVVDEEQQQRHEHAGLLFEALERRGYGNDEDAQDHAGDGEHEALVSFHDDLAGHAGIGLLELLFVLGIVESLPGVFLGLDRAHVDALEQGIEAQAHGVFLESHDGKGIVLFGVAAAVLEQKDEFAVFVVGVEAAVGGEYGHGGALGASVLDHDAGHGAAHGIDLAGEHDHVGHVLVEHAGLNDHAGAAACDVQHFGAEVSHAPGLPVNGDPEAEERAQDGEEHGRGQHLIEADASGLESDEFAVRAHAQEGKEHGEHAGYGADDEQEEGTQVAEQAQGIPDIELKAQEHVAQLKGASHEDEQKKDRHGQEEDLGVFQKQASLKKVHARASSLTCSRSRARAS